MIDGELVLEISDELRKQVESIAKRRRMSFGKALVLVIEVGANKLQVSDAPRRGRNDKLDTVTQSNIYVLWGTGQKTQLELAYDFGIGIATVRRICRKFKPDNI